MKYKVGDKFKWNNDGYVDHSLVGEIIYINGDEYVYYIHKKDETVTHPGYPIKDLEEITYTFTKLHKVLE